MSKFHNILMSALFARFCLNFCWLWGEENIQVNNMFGWIHSSILRYLYSVPEYKYLPWQLVYPTADTFCEDLAYRKGFNDGKSRRKRSW